MNRTRRAAWPLIVAAVCGSGSATADDRHDYPLAPMSFEQVTLQDSFWLPRLVRQAEMTVPHALAETEPAVENLRRCGRLLHGPGGELPFPHRLGRVTPDTLLRKARRIPSPWTSRWENRARPSHRRLPRREVVQDLAATGTTAQIKQGGLDS